MERRKRERGHNLAGLLHLARKMFAASPQGAFLTALDVQDVRPALEVGGRSLPPR